MNLIQNCVNSKIIQEKVKEPGSERLHNKEILMTSGELATSIKMFQQARDQIGLLVKPKK